MQKQHTKRGENRLAHFAEFDAEFLNGRSWVVGIDEAGRGALAGPVCAGAVAVSERLYRSPEKLAFLEGLNDSKKLSESAREDLYFRLEELRSASLLDFEARFASVEEIERDNILRATQTAMERACRAIDERLNLRLRTKASVATLFGESGIDSALAEILIDGTPMKKFPFVHRAVVKGDASSVAVAAASIVAKVSRDRFMRSLPSKYSVYDFPSHKGYGTAAHLQALMLYGASDIHRPSFLKKLRAAPVSDAQQSLF